MGPNRHISANGELFHQLLIELINMEHPLVKLATLIDWQVFERQWAGSFPPESDVLPPRRGAWRYCGSFLSGRGVVRVSAPAGFGFEKLGCFGSVAGFALNSLLGDLFSPGLL